MAYHRSHLAHAVALGNGHRTAQHDEHAGAGLTGGEEPLAAFELQQRAKTLDARNLGRDEQRKHLLAPACVHRGRVVW